MAFGLGFLVASLLAVAFIKKSDGAIRCYQCFDCANKNNITEKRDLKECKKVTLLEGMAKLGFKDAGRESYSEAELQLTMKDVLEQIRKVDPAEADELEKSQWSLPSSCFKVETTVKKKGFVYRGCGHKTTPHCEDEDDMKMCFCSGNGCNGATTFVDHFFYVINLSIAISLLNV